jgi:GntR family transcriptional repressor for pyruvate dehydrogenase complex
MTDTSLALEDLQPVGRTSVVDSVIDRLEDLIFGGLDAGETLPSEGQLAEALGVSRLTVREATRTLEARGLLEIRQGRRPTVTAPNGALIGDFFQIAIRRDPRALLDLLEVRRALEVHIATLAARRAGKGEIADMEMSIAAMRAGGDDSEAFHAADVRFHENLAAASGNRLLVFLIEAFAEPLRESRLRSFAGHLARGGGVEDVIQQHQTILDAVRAGNAKQAAKAMREHLEQTEQDLRTLLRGTANVERQSGEDHRGRAARRRRRVA